MTWALAINIFAAIGGLAGIGTFINLFLQRNKVKAEAADLEQSISDKVLKNLNAENERLVQERDISRAETNTIRNEVKEIREKMEKYEWDQYENRMLTIKLINWSRKAYEELIHHGSDIEAPPTKDLLVKFRPPHSL